MKPLVSICIPTYNGSTFIEEALCSAINQSYPNLEIVVSDDASSDNTLAIIESYKNKTNLPIYIYKHVPNGIGSNWNHCIKQAQGVYIKFLFQDDTLEPTCVEKMVTVLEHDKTIGMVASKRHLILEDSDLIHKNPKWMERHTDLQKTLGFNSANDLNVLTKDLFKSSLFFEEPINKIGEPTVVLIRKNILKDIGLFREDLEQMLDFEFYYRLLKKCNIAILNEKLVSFRLHENQTTNANIKKGVIKDDLVLYNKLIYKNYFWYVSSAKKLELLKKYNPLIRALFFIKSP